MQSNNLDLLPFLRATSVVDWHDASVSAQAASLKSDRPLETARACFAFVRDQIKHSRDFETGPATWRASDVLRHRTGYCYAKSHLLAALLRANELPAAFCYQRLSVNDHGSPYSLHGFNAVYLPEFGWYRMDARGNKPGVDAQFAPPTERLAFKLQTADEFEFSNLWPDPVAPVLDALRASASWQDVLARLPDIRPEEFAALGYIVKARGNDMRLN